MKWTRIACLVLACAATGDALARERTIDGRSDASFRRSLDAMRRSLDADEQKALEIALLQLTLRGVESAREIGHVKLDPIVLKAEIDGLDADAIIAKSRREATTKAVVVGEEPGVPGDLAAPLPPSTGTAAPLAGSAWTVTSDINGHLRRQRIVFADDGTLSAVTEDQARSHGVNRWEQSGDAFVLRMNDGYAVMRGKLVDGAMQGEAGNRMGARWTFEGTRESD